MSNWRTVNITGTMTRRDAEALRDHLGYSLMISPVISSQVDEPAQLAHDSALDHFGPLFFNRDQPSICGVNAWPAEEMDVAGNLAERGYTVEDVAEHLRELVAVAGSMMLVVHCGGEHESLKCVATIRVGEGVVAVMKPEKEKLLAITDEQMTLSMLRAWTFSSLLLAVSRQKWYS